ncbi:MAG TPA: LysM peptidoglycan-binding domain-containing protein [Verrucomicrobiota bacterium]|nr:LysM peptidoglycan-binding domain-containing protein [Verrucomicrobiota bacterium]
MDRAVGASMSDLHGVGKQNGAERYGDRQVILGMCEAGALPYAGFHGTRRAWAPPRAEIGTEGITSLADERSCSYVAHMQTPLVSRIVFGAAVMAASTWLMSDAKSQDASDEAIREEYEARFRSISAKIDDILGIQATLQRRINDLSAELGALREEQSRIAGQSVRPEDLRKLADKIREIDQKREDDKRIILEELRKLAQAPIPEPKPRKEETRKEETKKETEPSQPPVPQKGYEYVVKEGDTLSAIVEAYRQNGVNVTVDMVLKANPNVKPKSLRVGQKIFIPDPALK